MWMSSMPMRTIQKTSKLSLRPFPGASRGNCSLTLPRRRGQLIGLQPLGGFPEPFEIVELARFVRKHVNDKVDVVEQNPLSLFVSLDIVGAEACGLKAEFDLVGDGLNLPRVGTAAQNKVVGKRARAFLHFQNGELFGFFLEAGVNGGSDLLLELAFFVHSSSVVISDDIVNEVGARAPGTYDSDGLYSPSFLM